MANIDFQVIPDITIDITGFGTWYLAGRLVNPQIALGNDITVSFTKPKQLPLYKIFDWVITFQSINKFLFEVKGEIVDE